MPCLSRTRRVATQFRRTGAGVLLSLLVAGAPVVAGEPPLVYVAPLPSGWRAPAAAAVALQIRVALGHLGIRTLAEPTGENAAALEEITSTSRTGAAQVSVGIRLLSGSSWCVTVRAPQVKPSPKAQPTTGSELEEFVRQAELAERSCASQRLASHFSKLGPRCKAARDWASDYFLKEASGATVVLDVSANRAESLAAPAAEAIVLFLGEGGHPTSGCS
jgi:hypothetical protein